MKATTGLACVLGLAGAWAMACGSSSETATTASGGAGGTVMTNSGGGGNLSVGNGGSGGATNCATASAEVVPSPVDIIIIIDESASMGEEIQGVKDNLNTNLVQILANAGIDYRVIFVSNVSGLPMGPNYFQIDHGVNSSDALTLLLWTYDGDSRTANSCQRNTGAVTAWSGIARFDAHKFFIAVTDDDPSSFDCAFAASNCPTQFPTLCQGCANNCTATNPNGPPGYCPLYQCPTYADQPAAWGGDDFPTELYKLQPAGMFGTAQDPKWTFHSIVPVNSQLGPSDPIQPNGQVCNVNGNTGERSGVEYQKLSVLTGGLRFPSCDTDYSPVFQSIANTITPLACKFLLEQTNLGTPDPSKTNVEIDYGNGPQTVLRDDTAPCDSGADGWQFADNGTAVVLCGPTCDMLKASDNAQVSITVGCEAQVK